MLDLHTIPDRFQELACFHEVWGAERGQRLLHNELKLRDPHDDADAWLAATTAAERERIQAKAELRHAAVRRELARSIRSVTREEYLERKRQDMGRWRRAHKAENAERCAAWRTANREYINQYMRDYRRRMDPETKAAATKAAVKRKAERRAAHRLANPIPPRQKQSDEQRRAKQREWDRKWHRNKNASMTEEQRLARNAKQKARYDKKRAEQK